jgi:hypothetical protein
MANRIRIRAGKVVAEAELTDKPTAGKVWEALPIEGRANTWGDEIYFSIPVKAGGEPDAQAEMEVGGLGYWPPGSAFCIFFGPTPASRGSEPRAASPVNLLGKVIGDAKVFKAVADGEKVTLEKAGG